MRISHVFLQAQYSPLCTIWRPTVHSFGFWRIRFRGRRPVQSSIGEGDGLPLRPWGGTVSLSHRSIDIVSTYTVIILCLCWWPCDSVFSALVNNTLILYRDVWNRYTIIPTYIHNIQLLIIVKCLSKCVMFQSSVDPDAYFIFCILTFANCHTALLKL